MKNKKQITVIIPVYNCKNYLAECFDSIVNQTIGLDKLDVIIVDDGSTDGSDEVIKEYKKQYPEWKVISQNNAGLAAARNAALEHLKTEYVCFFDSDDILPKTALASLLKSAEKNKSDIVIGGMENFTSAGHRPNYTAKYLRSFDQISYKEYIHLLDFVHACGKLYRTDIIKNKRFIAGTKHEDNYFTLSLYLSSDKISMINKTVYCRRDREGNDKSITQSLDFNSFKDLLTNYDKALDENDYDEKVLKFLTRKIYHYIFKNLNKKDWRKTFALANDFRNKHKNGKIDFVITWVDGDDPKWLAEKEKWETKLGIMSNENIDKSEIRYRDWGTLKYWFRGVEQFAPWVNKIHFVTNGQIPDWLNTNHPKLHLVKHSDYMPKEALPSFNSNAIEMMVHKINGLSEQFVMFNDDFYLTNKIKPTDFFKHGEPVNAMSFRPIMASHDNHPYRTVANNLEIVNAQFDFKKSVKTNLTKYASIKQGKHLIITIPLLGCKYFPGFTDYHTPIAYLKTTFEDAWAAEPDTLYSTVFNKFRNYSTDNSHWLFNYWQFANGTFRQKSTKHEKNLSVAKQNLPKLISQKRYHILCIGDSNVDDFEKTQQSLIRSFEKILPEKSTYEK